MTVHQHTLTMRPITGRDELDLFCRLPYSLNEELADDLDAGRRRPEWMWLALAGDRVLARLAWWGSPDSAEPIYLDVFDLADDAHLDVSDLAHLADDARSVGSTDPVAIGVRLLRTATAATLPSGRRPPEYSRFVPPDWRDEPTARRIVETRMAALEQTGARLLVERLRLEWRPGTPIPEPSGRLHFRPVRDRADLVGLMTSVLEGTLDAHGREELTRMPAEQSAAEQFDRELAAYRSPREWWRVATLPTGEPVGFVTPGHNNYNPVIGYVAVLPEHRGHGYVDDILAEGTRILAEQGVPRIRAATDLGNVPMARSFARAGYVNFERAINMTWE